MAISTQKTVCNKMNNSIQTDKIYLNAMLEVIRWTSNLDQYYRDVVVTEMASNVRLIIGELERVISLRMATVGEGKSPQFNGIESRSASEAARDFLLERERRALRKRLYGITT